MRPLASLVLVGLLGCSSTPEAPTEPEDDPGVIIEEEGPGIPEDEPDDPGVPPGEVSTPNLPEGEPHGRLATALRRFEAIMMATKTAAREAAEAEDGDACSKGRASMLGAIAGANAAFAEDPLEGRTAPSWEVADEAEYLQLCRGLSAELQRCSRLDFRTDRSSGCVAVMQAATEEEQAIMLRMSHPVRGEAVE